MLGDFPHSSVGKESACNPGDPSLIPGSRRSVGEGIGYPLQYTWASLVAQLVKNPLAMCGRPGFDPGLGRFPGEGKSYPLAWRTLWSGEFHGLYSPWGHKESYGVMPEWISLHFTNAGEGMEKSEFSYTTGGNVNWYNHYGNSMEVT